MSDERKLTRVAYHRRESRFRGGRWTISNGIQHSDFRRLLDSSHLPCFLVQTLYGEEKLEQAPGSFRKGVGQTVAAAANMYQRQPTKAVYSHLSYG